MKNRKKILLIGIAVVLTAAAVLFGWLYTRKSMAASEITEDEARQMIADAFAAMPGKYARDSIKYIESKSSFEILSMDYGLQKNIEVTCTFHTIDARRVISENIALLLDMDTKDPVTGIEMTSTKLKLKIDEKLLPLLSEAAAVTQNVTVELYETADGFRVYTSDAVVDAYFGGVVSAAKDVMALTSIESNGKTVTVNTNLKKGLTECFSLTYASRQPDVSVPLIRTWNDLKYEFERNFIQNQNWKYIVKGLWVTVRVTFFALIIGVVLGFLVAIVRCTNEKTGKLKFLNVICRIYLTVLRGTPVLVQLMIIYFVIFMPIGIDKFIAAVICFGLNSGAYVAEIVRGGIMAVDSGQMEAGRSLGFNYAQTMWYIILPQTFKAVLPALANEFIVLLKETSVSAYIGLNDLARGGDIIRGATYSAFMPLVAVAVVYLVVVMFLQWLVGKLERRLRSNER